MKEKLLELVEKLREAGQRTHLEEETWGHGACLSKFGRPCDCGVAELNTQVDAAAKALVAEIEWLPELDCAKCARTECPHSGKYPARPGPPHGCGSFKGGPT